jgi:hypothetical protein
MEAPQPLGCRLFAVAPATLRNTTARDCRQRRRIISLNYASNLRFVSMLRGRAPERGRRDTRSELKENLQASDIKQNISSLPWLRKVPALLNFFAGPRISLLYLIPQGNSVMHCTKQKGDPGV